MISNYVKSQRQRGFTLIEIVIVIAIAALLLAALLIFVPTVQKNRRDAQRKDNIGKLSSQIEQYAADHGGTYPPNGAAIPNIATIKDPSSGSQVTFGSGTCGANGATTTLTVGTYYYNIATGSTPYHICTPLESKVWASNF